MLIISPLYHFTSNIRVFSAIGLRVSLDVTHLLMCSMLMSASILCTLHLVYCFDGLFNNKMASLPCAGLSFGCMLIRGNLIMPIISPLQ